MKISKSRILINSGLIMIILSLLLICYNLQMAYVAGKSSSEVSVKLDKLIGARNEASVEAIPDYILNPDMSMPVISVDGWNYIGFLDIPDLNLNLPVIEQYSPQAIKMAPACYDGTAYKENFVICAHNYRSHFGLIGQLDENSIVTFTDADGNVFTYKVSDKETLSPKQKAELFSDQWDFTLVSCTASGQYRIAVRCTKSEI